MYADAEWDYRDYDFDTWQEDTKFVSEIVDATDTDLSAFKASGGRMIIWHGWSDAAMSALATIEYYEAVEAQDSDVRDYLRMYLLPGVMHCGNGPGPSRVDWDAAIVEWVEHGKAPGALIASKRQDGQITMTRPLCVYPERAVYIGSGSTDEATSFECRAHEPRRNESAYWKTDLRPELNNLCEISRLQ